MLKLFERWTTLLIRLNTHTEIRERPFVTIIHGHYRDWFAGLSASTSASRGRFAYFGLIRRYKAVDTLLAAFRQLPTDGEPVSLYVGGTALDRGAAGRGGRAGRRRPQDRGAPGVPQ